MPQHIILDPLPTGFALNGAREGEQVQVQVRGFASSEDGLKLVTWLDALVSPCLALLKRAPPPSMIDNLVAVVQRDGKTKVFVNEVNTVGQVRAKAPVQAGSVVLIDHVADFGPLQLVGVDVPSDAGIIVFLSSGWRRGLFFDFGPCSGAERAYDLASVLGSAWGYIAFQDRVHISDTQWEALFKQQWFPFIGLKADQVRDIVGHVESGWDAAELLPKIADDLAQRSAQMLEHATKVPALDGHVEVLRAAVKHFCEKDWLSAAALLFPRIEGILRAHAKQLPGQASYSQKALAQAAAADSAGSRLPGSLLLPDRFQAFLEAVYFTGFDPNAVTDVSRNTVSHGVVPEAKLDIKAATLALLIVEQLLYLCGGAKVAPPATVTP